MSDLERRETPPPAGRLMHTRTTVFRGYLRDDRLWEIEAELRDTKTFDGLTAEHVKISAGTPIHQMLLRLTIDDELLVHDVWSSLPHTPFAECQATQPPLLNLVGARLGPGWRQAIDEALGKARGCTHVRELLFNMASAAYQTVAGTRQMQIRAAGKENRDTQKVPPYHLGQCIGWDFNGAVVARIWPQFAGWQPIKGPRKGD